MKNQIQALFVPMLLALVSSSALAEIKLPAIVSSNMVLQRNAEINLWGWSEPDEQIYVEVSWTGEKLSAKADKSGKWRLQVATTDSKEVQRVVVSSQSEEIVLDNILLGEVWFCSGQSNMEMHVRGFIGQPTYGSTEALLKSNNPNIRLFTLTSYGSKTPLEDPVNYSPWVQASPESVADFGAVAWFFGSGMNEFLDVPVGLIHSTRGASRVQAWMSIESVSEFEEVNWTIDELDLDTNKRLPTALYNAMVHPVIPYTIKGAIWYQGESNISDPEGYKKLFPAMVQDWRDKWGQGDFPFYFVQIAPFPRPGNDSFQGFGNTAFMREAQLQCVDLIPNSGIAITMDIGDENTIHPPRKKEVGVRLLLQALSKTYGVAGLNCESPTYSSLIQQDGGLVLKFDHAESGLFSFEGLEDFEIAGEDRVFYPAVAVIPRQRGGQSEVFVKSPLVPNPVSVRYGWKNWMEGTLFNGSLLPASSFRTDDWNDATRAELVVP